jgi:LAO/AO transport system kinase
LTCSAIQQTGLIEIWQQIVDYERQLKANGFWQRQRDEQRITWMHRYIQQQLLQRFYSHDAVKKAITTAEDDVQAGKTLPITAAKKLLNIQSEKFRRNS